MNPMSTDRGMRRSRAVNPRRRASRRRPAAGSRIRRNAHPPRATRRWSRPRARVPKNSTRSAGLMLASRWATITRVRGLRSSVSASTTAANTPTDATQIPTGQLASVKGTPFDFTTEPGVQFYTSNFIEGAFTGTSGHVYRQGAGFTMETQHYPDSPNHPNFPTTTLVPSRLRLEDGVRLRNTIGLTCGLGHAAQQVSCYLVAIEHRSHGQLGGRHRRCPAWLTRFPGSSTCSAGSRSGPNTIGRTGRPESTPPAPRR
jgi:hypothetical protein